MAAPDYLIFEQGNPLTNSYVGSWFETFDLLGYFEQLRVRADGTVWLTPTNIVPSKHLRNDMDAPELIKVTRPPVQLLIQHQIQASCGDTHLSISFNQGCISEIQQLPCHSEVAA